MSIFGSLGPWYLGRPEGAGLTSGTLSASRSTGHSWQAESPICHLHNVPMATFSAGKDGKTKKARPSPSLQARRPVSSNYPRELSDPRSWICLTLSNTEVR